MASDSVIWRVLSTGAEPSDPSEAVQPDPSVDKILFNDLSISETKQSSIIQSQTTMTSAIAVNAKPKEALDELQDTGFSELTVVLTGSIKEPKNNGLIYAHKLKTWMLEDKTNASFPYGRFGLRMNDFSIFNLTPNANRGYIISDVSFTRDGETSGKIGVIITLRLNGNNTSTGIPGTANGDGQYIW